MTESTGGDRRIERWTYARLDDKKEQERSLFVQFDVKTGQMCGYGDNFRILEPAVVTLKITSDFWRREVLPKIDAKYLPGKDTEDQYLAEVILESVPSRAGFSMITDGPHETDFVPDHAYQREVLHGDYRLVLKIRQRQPWNYLANIVLKEGLVLEKNSRPVITLE